MSGRFTLNCFIFHWLFKFQIVAAHKLSLLHVTQAVVSEPS